MPQPLMAMWASAERAMARMIVAIAIGQTDVAHDEIEGLLLRGGDRVGTSPS